MFSHRHSHSSDIPKCSRAGIGCARANDLIYQILPAPYMQSLPHNLPQECGAVKTGHSGAVPSAGTWHKHHARARDTLAGLARGF